MKNLKLIIALFIVTALIFSCNKQVEQPYKKMTVEQLKAETKIDLIAAWEIQFGNARTTPNGKSKKPQKGDVINLVLDGELVFDGTTFTTSGNPKFAGVNNQTTVISICNWFFYEGGSAQTLSCNTVGQTGNIMAWNTDWSDNVYRSNIITQ